MMSQTTLLFRLLPQRQQGQPGPATGCVGGETVFYPELGPAKKFSGKASDRTDPISVDLEVGMALLHKHGQDCLLHEGKTVRKGEKWVIRSDFCVKR